ncbi:MAG: L-threonylcarbamoyladenylate synthase [Eubacteriales bacterium]
MQTKIVNLSESINRDTVIQAAGQCICQGGLVAFPTETVYGLGGDALNPQSAHKIYEAKGRPSDNPLIIHIATVEALSSIISKKPEQADVLMEAFWPGPITMIFEKSDLVPMETTGGLTTVAVRMPEHQYALELINATGGYVAAPSANTSGKPSPTLAKHVIEDLSGKVDMILDGGLVGIGIESTILDLTGEIPMILRPGAITKDMIEEVIGRVEYDPSIFTMEEERIPRAPGMKYKHYAPQGELTIVEGEERDVICTINKHTTSLLAKGALVGVIATNETAHAYLASHVKSVGNRHDEETIGRRLYQILREFDEEGMTHIYSEAFATTGMGQAIMNRLLKAAGHEVEVAYQLGGN